MMRKLDQRGVAALEFCLVAVPLFTLMFVIFDLGRYAITMQSLRTLASAEARGWMIQCGTPTALGISASCTSDYLSAAQKQGVAPFLYAGGLTPAVSISTGASPRTFTASQPGFAMLMPIWGAALNAPSASTSVPF
jgi:TadE-like protein